MPVGDSAYTTASVTGLFRHRVPQVLSLRWASGDTLGVTPAHPFFSKDRGRWVPAGELAVGERVLAKAGTQVLEGTKIWPGERTVYNLEVGGAHNFLVGKGGVVVHNGCAAWKPRYYSTDGTTWNPIQHIMKWHGPFGANSIRVKERFLETFDTETKLKNLIDEAIESADNSNVGLNFITYQGQDQIHIIYDAGIGNYVGYARDTGSLTTKIKVALDFNTLDVITAFPIP